jgi:hypothetical protein
MTIRQLRLVVAILCALSIAGMIVGSVKDNNGLALTAGVFGAIGVLCLVVGNAIHIGTNAGGAQDALGVELEARVQDLVATGVDEQAVRQIVRRAVRLGRGDGSRSM